MDGSPSDNLYVKGLPEEFGSDAVQSFFSACGTVTEAKSLGHGNALVRFASLAEAAMVKENMHGQQPAGCPKPLEIHYAVTKDHDDWNCPACGDLQFARNSICRMCGCPRGGLADVLAPVASMPGTAADLAIAKDPADLRRAPLKVSPGAQAGKAGAFKAGPGPQAGKAGQVPMEGDWTCPTCGDLQFARNTACRMCGGTRSGGWAFGKAGACKGGGAASPYGKAGVAAWGGQGHENVGIQAVIDGLINEGLPGGFWEKEKNAVYLTNLPPDTTDADLYTIFASFGAIPPRGVRIMPGQPGRRRYGFVNFMDASSADAAVYMLNGYLMPDGGDLVVKLKVPKSETATGAGTGFAAATPGGIDSIMRLRLTTKLAQGPMSAYDLSNWYILQFLADVHDEGEMKAACDMLLAACSELGLT